MTFLRCLLACLLLVACQRGPQLTTISGVTMTVPYRILVGARLNETQMMLAQKIIQTTFSEIDDTFNQWNSDSEVSRFNRQPADQPFALSRELSKFLQRCNEIVKLTEGRFDPTVEPIWKLWLDNLRQAREPSAVAMAEVSARVGWKHLKFEDNSVTKDINGVSLTLDSISKGYAVDLLTERLVSAGFTHVLVEWGGEMRSAGQHPEGRSWRVAIRSLDGQIEPIANLELINSAVATSGDYLQFWTTDAGVTYTHVVNPTTLQAVQIQPGTMASVSVLAPDCMLADALATAAMAWGNVDAAEPWMQRVQTRTPGVQFWFLPR